MENELRRIILNDVGWYRYADAVLATNKVRAMQHHVGAVSALLAELAYGDVKPRIRDDGFYVVENEEIRMSFKKKENGDGVSE